MIARLFSISLVVSTFAMPAVSLTMKDGVRWPDTTIPVCWEEMKRAHAQERDLVRKSVTWTWEKESAVRFTGWRRCEDDSAGVRITLETTFPQTHGRGRELDGKPAGVILPSLWSLAALSINLKAPVHEFGHVLGFGHEYARADAPDLERCSAKGADGAPYTESDQHLTPFDVDSIMVACVADATRKFSIGTPKLSAADIFGLVDVYGSHPDNVLDRDETGDQFGAALQLDDLDGDGTGDLAVAAPGEDAGEGAVYLFRGDTFKGFRPWRRLSPADLSTVAFRHLGEKMRLPATPADKVTFSADQLSSDTAASAQHPFPALSGQSAEGVVTLAADLNGDGVEDLIIGAPNADGAEKGSGVVIILRGVATNTGATVHTNWYWFGQAY